MRVILIFSSDYRQFPECQAIPLRSKCDFMASLIIKISVYTSSFNYEPNSYESIGGNIHCSAMKLKWHRHIKEAESSYTAQAAVEYYSLLSVQVPAGQH